MLSDIKLVCYTSIEEMVVTFYKGLAQHYYDDVAKSDPEKAKEIIIPNTLEEVNKEFGIDIVFPQHKAQDFQIDIYEQIKAHKEEGFWAYNYQNKEIHLWLDPVMLINNGGVYNWNELHMLVGHELGHSFPTRDSIAIRYKDLKKSKAKTEIIDEQYADQFGYLAVNLIRLLKEIDSFYNRVYKSILDDLNKVYS